MPPPHTTRGSVTTPPRGRRAAGQAALLPKIPSVPGPPGPGPAQPSPGRGAGRQRLPDPAGTESPSSPRPGRPTPSPAPAGAGPEPLTRHGTAQVPHMAAERPAGEPAPLRLRAPPASSPGRSASRVAPPRAPPARDQLTALPAPAARLAPRKSPSTCAGSAGGPRGRDAGGSPAGERLGRGWKVRPRTARGRGGGWGPRSGFVAQTGIPRAEAFPRAAGGRGSGEGPGSGLAVLGPRWCRAPREAAGRPRRPSARASLGRSLGTSGEDPALLSSRAVAAPGGHRPPLTPMPSDSHPGKGSDRALWGL